MATACVAHTEPVEDINPLNTHFDADVFEDHYDMELGGFFDQQIV
jgi:hypothetical protein